MAQRQLLASILGLFLACSIGCLDSDDYLPTAPLVTSSLELESSAESLPADGLSRLILTARINPEAGLRKVRFTVSAGSLLSSTANPPRELEVSADSRGIARAELRSDTTPQTAFITAEVRTDDGNTTLVSRRIEIPFVPADSDRRLQVSTSANTVVGDDVSRIFVFADISPELSSREVAFAANLGRFGNGERAQVVTADGSNRATVDYIGGRLPDEARVSATAGGVTVNVGVTVLVAPPEHIVVEPHKVALAAIATDSVKVEARLFRTTGKVTPRTIVQYRVVDASTHADLGFTIQSIQPSSDDGVSEATVIAGATEFRGTARVIAGVGDVFGSATFQVVNPP